MSNLDVYQTGGWYVAYVEKSKYLEELWTIYGFDFKEGFYLFSKYYPQSTPPPGDGEYLGGYRTIVPEAATKNRIVVGAVDGEKNMTDFSGWGPTETGQTKPDVVGNGHRLPRLLSASGGYLEAYKGSGTSYSAPSVTGTAVLLVEHFQNLWEEPESILKETTNSERPFSATIKALLIHTAEDLGNEGPDYQFGWGLIDAKGAADFLTKANKPESDKFLLERVHSQRQHIQVISDGKKPLKVMMAWTDKPGKNIVNDLDLRVREVTANGYETYYPWSLNPNKPDRNATANRPNKLDNVEQVLIKETKKDAKYVILVDGDIDDSESSQYYSLLIGGAQKPPSVGKVSCGSLPYRTRKGTESTGKIISASVKPTAEGYSLTMIEENGEEHVLNFDQNLYLQSAGTVADADSAKDFYGVYKAGDLIPWNLIANIFPLLKIQSNGSFMTVVLFSTPSVCSFEGTAQFFNGAKNEIFGLSQD